MRIKRAYGKTGFPLELDDSLDVTVVEPVFVPPRPSVPRCESRLDRPPSATSSARGRAAAKKHALWLVLELASGQ